MQTVTHSEASVYVCVLAGYLIEKPAAVSYTWTLEVMVGCVFEGNREITTI